MAIKQLRCLQLTNTAHFVTHFPHKLNPKNNKPASEQVVPPVAVGQLPSQLGVKFKTPRSGLFQQNLLRMDASAQEKFHSCSRKIFAVILIALEIAIVALYAVFVRVEEHVDIQLNQTYYPMYQDVNVMMLIGFGFLMTFIKRHAWSALSYTFFINAIVVQLYILLAGFWERVFQMGFKEEREIILTEQNFTAASYSVAAMLIAFGAVLGKVGPLQLLIMSMFGIVGYTLNETLVYTVLEAFDVGGSTAIHTFGAYFGLAVSFMLWYRKKIKVLKNVEESYTNATFAMIGTLFLWMFWPSFNAGYFPQNGFQRSLIITNTILSLTGSCLATFIVSALKESKFGMEAILNATLAGGVAIGAPSGVIVNPAISLFIGLLAGSVSALGYTSLSKRLESIGLHDTCGVNNLHGIPGIMGGVISGVVIGAYRTGVGIFPAYKDQISVLNNNRTYIEQGGIQVAATFMSMGIGLVFGLVTGLVISFYYKFVNEELFEDKTYFEIPHEDINHHPLALNETLQTTVVAPKKKLPPLHHNPEQPSEIVLDVSRE